MIAWDEAKRLVNLAKHGVDFGDVDGFNWTKAQIRFDGRRDYGEVRFVAVVPGGAELFLVVYTERHGEKRIISARRANRREARQFFSHNHPPDLGGG
jgi:hypothetical protein